MSGTNHQRVFGH